MRQKIVLAIYVVVQLLIFLSCIEKVNIQDENLFEPNVYSSPLLDNQVRKEISGFNTSRDENNIIVYQPAYGETTKTNEWGSEVVVEGSIVISKWGNNSRIPENGFVISGNGEGSDWINTNIQIGMEIHVEDQTVVLNSNENTKLRYSEYLVKRADQRIKENKHEGQNFTKLEETKNKLKDLIGSYIVAKEKKNIKLVEQHSERILHYANKYLYSTFPGKDEFKGVWIRLADKSPEELKHTIKRIANAGFNAILPETIYNSYAIYPDAHEYLPQLPQFRGWDPLQIIIDECKEYNIEVIPWCEMFFVGFEESPVLKKNPEWSGCFRNGLEHSLLEPNFRYVCHSRPEVKQFLFDALEALITRYDLEGVQLDYIRYPLSTPWQKGFCYCDFCQEKVKELHGFDIMELTPEHKNKWDLWNKYRVRNVSAFVERVSHMVRKRRPTLRISAAVVPDSEKSLEYKFQDWNGWVQSKLLDDVFIMSYSSDNNIVGRDCEILDNNVSETNVRPIVGLGPYLGIEPYQLLQQIETARMHNAEGVCLFAFNSMTEEQLEALKEGIFNNNRRRDFADR